MNKTKSEEHLIALRRGCAKYALTWCFSREPTNFRNIQLTTVRRDATAIRNKLSKQSKDFADKQFRVKYKECLHGADFLFLQAGA